jgi:HSP20 family molecular chaperone IbpA
MLVRWSPFMPTVKTDHKSIFDSFFDGDIFENIFQSMGVHQSKNEDGTYSMSVDVPGIKEQDINLSLDDNVVTIKGERKTATSSYKVNRSFTIPDQCDPDSLKADLKDGVLTLTLTLKQLPETKEPKKIPITTTK